MAVIVTEALPHTIPVSERLNRTTRSFLPSPFTSLTVELMGDDSLPSTPKNTDRVGTRVALKVGVERSAADSAPFFEKSTTFAGSFGLKSKWPKTVQLCT